MLFGDNHTGISIFVVVLCHDWGKGDESGGCSLKTEKEFIVLSNVCPLIYPEYMPECQHDADPYKNDTHRGVHMFKFH